MEEKSLKELCEAVLYEQDCKKRLQEIIVNDKLSAEFIKEQLHDQELDIPVDDNSDLYEIAASRARHSVVTYLMGQVFMKFLNFREKICKLCDTYVNISVDELWMLTALYHDSGYYSKLVEKENFDFENEFKEDYLLGDKYQSHRGKLDTILVYSFEEIKNYARYKSEYYSKKFPQKKEKVDHGILGGCITYRKLLRKSRKNRNEISEPDQLKTEIFCLTIAQHNIYKSPNAETDKVYEEYGLQRLKHNSELRISMDAPLLLLLSLVDTVECVKKLSKGENDNKYLETSTILNSIKINIEEDKLKVDFEELNKRCLDKKDGSISDSFCRLVENISSLNTWTNFNVQKNGLIFEIKYQ